MRYQTVIWPDHRLDNTMACKHDFVRVSSKWITEKFGLWHRRCLSVSSPGLLYYKQVHMVVRRERDHNWNKPVSTVDDRAWCPNTVLSGHQSKHTLFATTQVKIQARYRCPSTGSELEFCCFNVGTSSLLHTFFLAIPRISTTLNARDDCFARVSKWRLTVRKGRNLYSRLYNI